MVNDKKHVNRGLAWVGLASSLIGVLDIVSMVIVQVFFVTPEEFGIAILAGTLFNILDLTTNMGMTTAVIQRDDHSEEKLSTVFWLNTFLAVALSLILLGVGPMFGRFHGAAAAGSILMAYSIKLMLSNVYSVPTSLMKKELRFKELSTIRVLSNVAEAVGKVVAAALGATVWFHFIGRMLSTIVTAIGVQMCRPWRPRFILRLRESSEYIRFGIKASGSQLLYQLYSNLDYQIVGWFFGTAAAGFYHLAYTVAIQPVRIVSLVIVELALPVYARLKYKKEELAEQLISFTRLNLLLVAPILATMALSMEEILLVFWSPEWLPVAPAARIICIVSGLGAMSFLLPPLLDGIGKPGLTLLYNIVAAFVLIGSYLLFAKFLGPRIGFYSVAVAWAVGYPLAFLTLFSITFRELQMRPAQYIKAITPIFLCVAAAASVGFGTREMLASAPAALRLAGIFGSTLGCTMLLYNQFLGLRISTIRQALQG